MWIFFLDSTSTGGGQEFNDFVGSSTTNQNGTGNGSTTTTTSSDNQNSFFADFAEMSTSTSVNSTNSNSSNENQPQKQQTMSKDSIMALFNQRPAAAPGNKIFCESKQKILDSCIITSVLSFSWKNVSN